MARAVLPNRKPVFCHMLTGLRRFKSFAPSPNCCRLKEALMHFVENLFVVCMRSLMFWNQYRESALDRDD